MSDSREGLQTILKRCLWWLLAAGAMLGVAIVVWVLPETSFLTPCMPTSSDPIDVTRKTLLQLIGGLALLLSIVITWRRMTAAEKTLAMTQEGNTTDLFVEAIKLLGEQDDNKMAMRLGGIYALERIAKASKNDHGPIMEILTAYVREKSPRTYPTYPDAEEYAEDVQIPPVGGAIVKADIQAILTVLGRRTIDNDRKGSRLDLSKTNLRRADLAGADLRNAYLFGTNLEEVGLENADLRGALLASANLWYTRFKGAKLEGTCFPDANFWQTQLEGANLAGAKCILQEQIDDANYSEDTILPPGIVRKRQTEGAAAAENNKGEAT